MAGSLGRVPSEGELIQSFRNKGVKVTVAQAKRILDAVTDHVKGKSGGGGRRSADADKPVSKPSAPRAEVATRRTERTYGGPKHTSSYGRR